jgi:hypothetical protein
MNNGIAIALIVGAMTVGIGATAFFFIVIFKWGPRPTPGPKYRYPHSEIPARQFSTRIIMTRACNARIQSVVTINSNRVSGSTRFRLLIKGQGPYSPSAFPAQQAISRRRGRE